MIFSWILGILIFTYAGYALYRHIQRSKEGKCAKCDVSSSCGSANASCCDGNKLSK